MADEAGESSLLLQQTKSTPTTPCYSTEISIHEAAFDGNIEAVKQHIAGGTDVNAKDESGEETPLDTAISNDQTKTADLLRKHGGKTSEELTVAP